VAGRSLEIAEPAPQISLSDPAVQFFQKSGRNACYRLGLEVPWDRARMVRRG
jgi:hypothetical protein